MKQGADSRMPTLGRTSANVGAAWLYKVLAVIAALFLTGLGTRYFGLEAIGLWVLASGIAAHFLLLDLGLSSSLPRTLPRLFSANDHEAASRIVATGVTFSLFAGLLLLCASPLIGWVAASYQPVREDLRWLAGILTAVAIASAAVSLPLRAGFGLLASVHRFDLYFGIEIAVLALKTMVVAMALLLFEQGLIVYAALMAMVPLTAAVIQFHAGLRHCRVERPIVRRMAWGPFLELLSLSGASLLMTLAAAISVQGSSILAGYALSPEAAAVLSLPMVVVVSAMAFSSFGGFLSPMASALHGIGTIERMRRVVTAAVRTSTALAVLTAVVVWIAGPLFLRVWLEGPKVDRAAIGLMADVMAIIAFGMAALAPGSTAKGMLASTGRHWSAAKVDLAGSGATMLLGLLLLTVFQQGVIALCWAIVIGFVARGLLGLPLLTARALQMPFLAYTRHALLAPFSIGLVIAATALPLRDQLGGANDFLAVAVATIFAVVLWLIATWMFVLAPPHKERVLALARSCLV